MLYSSAKANRDPSKLINSVNGTVVDIAQSLNVAKCSCQYDSWVVKQFVCYWYGRVLYCTKLSVLIINDTNVLYSCYK